MEKIIVLNENGYMRTNCWRRLNSTQKWYYYGGDGAALTDTWIDGTYYVGADGAMLVDCLTPDGYRVDSRGRWIEGAEEYMNKCEEGTKLFGSL